MDENIQGLINRLFEGAATQWTGDGSDNREVDIRTTNNTMEEAGIILRAIFDPENQPSQFGTVLAMTSGPLKSQQ